MTRVTSLLYHDVYVTSPTESGFASDVAQRYKLSLSEFDAQMEGIARVRQDAPIVASGLSLDAHAGTALPYLITFDDGGVSYYTVVAERLEWRGWRGHCFVSTDLIGRRGFLDADQIRELDAHGHVIGSHSASHPARFSACTPDRMRNEWAQSRRVLEDIVGHTVDVASVPGGYFSKAVARAACEAGIRVLFTSEPITSIERVEGCLTAGRYAIRDGDAPDASQQFVRGSRKARSLAWIDWNAKGLVKPLLGPAYIRFSAWLAAH